MIAIEGVEEIGEPEGIVSDGAPPSRTDLKRKHAPLPPASNLRTISGMLKLAVGRDREHQNYPPHFPLALGVELAFARGLC